MINDVFVLGKDKYPYKIDNNGEIFVKGTQTHYKVHSNGKVYYYGSFVSDRLDMNTWSAIITKTFRK